MRDSWLLLLFLVFSVQSALKSNQRTVNVALETSLLFEPKDIKSNLGLVKNIRSFLDKIYETLEPHAEPTYRQTEDSNSLPDFLQHLGSKFLNFSSDDIKSFTDVLKQHVSSYTSRARSTYHEIFSAPTLKQSLKQAIEHIANMDGEKLKERLNQFMKSNKPMLRRFTDRLNAFYTEKDLTKFYKFVKKIDKYVRKKKDVSAIIKEWLDFGIFERYNKLNYTSKVKLLNDMNLLKDYFDGETKFRAQEKESSSKYDEDVSGSEGDDVHKHHRHSHKDKDKTEKLADSNEKQADGRKTEVVVDNIEFFINTVQQ